mmetsp:Transcript_116808/g.277506  ORF Transcript_116808/g.277506 Transcript_116808/m.277506 type:complete len:260 (-) Transcript_116808:575-1354(-)
MAPLELICNAILLEHLQCLLDPSLQLLWVCQVHDQFVLGKLKQHACDLLCQVGAWRQRQNQDIQLLAVHLPLHLLRAGLHGRGRRGRVDWHGRRGRHLHQGNARNALRERYRWPCRHLAESFAFSALLPLAFVSKPPAVLAPALAVAILHGQATPRVLGLALSLAAVGDGPLRLAALRPDFSRIHSAGQEVKELVHLEHVAEQVADREFRVRSQVLTRDPLQKIYLLLPLLHAHGQYSVLRIIAGARLFGRGKLLWKVI